MTALNLIIEVNAKPGFCDPMELADMILDSYTRDPQRVKAGQPEAVVMFAEWVHGKS